MREEHFMEHEQVERQVAQKSALIYIPISLGLALLFFLASTFTGNYPIVARLGGTVWVALLSLIVSMPIVISSVKKRQQIPT
jgi:cation transport ATPase